jgi:hypothetical protein
LAMEGFLIHAGSLISRGSESCLNLELAQRLSVT